jgi:hypothetical protein
LEKSELEPAKAWKIFWKLPRQVQVYLDLGVGHRVQGWAKVGKSFLNWADLGKKCCPIIPKSAQFRQLWPTLAKYSPTLDPMSFGKFWQIKANHKATSSQDTNTLYCSID